MAASLAIIHFCETVADHAEFQRRPTRTVGSSIGGQSYSTGSSPSLSHDLHGNYDDEEGEEPHSQVDRENSFEDLEQFLSQLDWAPPHGSTDDTGSDLQLSGDPSAETEQDEGNIQELEMRALAEHLKGIVKDIHIAIGEHSDENSVSKYFMKMKISFQHFFFFFF